MASKTTVFLFLVLAFVAISATALAQTSDSNQGQAQLVLTQPTTSCGSSPVVFQYNAGTRQVIMRSAETFNIVITSWTLTGLDVGASSRIALFDKGDLACHVVVGSFAHWSRRYALVELDGKTLTQHGDYINLGLETTAIAADDFHQTVLVAETAGGAEGRQQKSCLFAVKPGTGDVVTPTGVCADAPITEISVWSTGEVVAVSTQQVLLLQPPPTLLPTPPTPSQ